MTITATRDQLRMSTRMLYDELTRQGATVDILDTSSSLLEYTTAGGIKHFLFSTCSDKSSATGLIIADSKRRTAAVTTRLNIPMPAQVTSHDIREIRKFFAKYKRIVIKPVLGSGGKGVSVNITTDGRLRYAYARAKSHSRMVVAQQHLMGDDVRLLVVDGEFCSAVIRKPAHIVGDGTSSVKEIIFLENTTLLRNGSTQSSLMQINPHAARQFLGEKINEIIPKGQELRVIGPANISLGGSLHEATALVTKAMIADAEKITKKLGLGICGVDMIWNHETGTHHLIEVNATPGIDIHNDPFSGTSSDCVQRYVNWLVA